MQSFAFACKNSELLGRLSEMLDGYEYMCEEQYRDDISTIIDILQNDLN